MKVMVFDVPAENGGALSILKEFYREVKFYEDKNIQWIFVLSKPMLKETKNIKIIRYPWAKKSWLHRMYFDQIKAPKLVRKFNPDKIFSLQNVIIPRVKVEQIIYIHQSLPFVNHRFSIRENKLFWVYQNIVSKIIFKSIKRSKKVIVQLNWFKDACIEKTAVAEEKIKVIPPKVNIDIKKYFSPTENSLSTFFYPAGASYYKNHRTIVEACKKLKSKGVNNYKVLFTLTGNENEHLATLYNRVIKENLQVEFLGSISREDVFKYYSKTVLIFPSYIETFGLPMLESKMHKGVILAANTPFSHEILDGYENAYFFNAFDSDELATLMIHISKGKINFIDDVSVEKKISKVLLIDEVLD
ncbi:glycosyltransferase family 4 protein [Cerasibacillus terrae]|uniref:Glycosyltransferase family 4 protein n=1 Tax=Cerasibacillus terrae TaxID=2498845 RepID=A0A5C8P0U1_9BACI|nr:glycosyltransferase [Cerasibacillus terrae]TXL66872.1 glycosyltransferase family 4 protein [Cerasibacillus terrae]